MSVLDPDEFLISLRIPPPILNFGAAYLRFTPRNEMDIAVVGVGASLVLKDNGSQFVSARIALGAVAPTPLLVQEAGDWLAGRPVSTETIEKAASIAREAAKPINDMRGTISQRKHLTGILTRRVIETAINRATKRI
jgi:carbon-monoxide dehydrogenase medium subunit